MEHFIALEIRAYLSYRRKHESLNYWRTQHGQEVDFIIGEKVAIEVKAAERITEKHLHGLELLAEENICERFILISLDRIKRKQGQCEIIHWQEFLELLWSDKVI